MDELSCDRMRDADLVAAARRRDRRAMAVLLERHRPLLLGLCRRVLGDRDLAQDAAQEACVTALLNLDRLRDLARFGPWLGGIGLNISRRWLRTRPEAAWSWETLPGGLLATALPAAPDPHELVELRQLGTRVWEAVAALPAGQRDAVWRFYFAGLTHAEIAAELGASVGAVKTRLHKGRARLRRDLWQVWREEHMSGVSTGAELVEMRVADVRRVPAAEEPSGRHVVLLEEPGGDRSLAIWIGPAEAVALAMAVEGEELPRPLTYSFTASLLRAAGARLREVRVERLAEGTFYASAVVDGPAGEADVDARPSDALNLALVAGAPIRVAAEVITQAEAAAVDHPDLPSAAALRGEAATGTRELLEDVRERLRQAKAAFGSGSARRR